MFNGQIVKTHMFVEHVSRNVRIMCVCVCVSTLQHARCVEGSCNCQRPDQERLLTQSCNALHLHGTSTKSNEVLSLNLILNCFFKPACVHGQKDKPDKNLQIFNFRYKLHICHHLHGGALNKAVNLGHSLKLGTFTKFRHFSASSPSPEAVDSIAVSLFSNNYSETSKLVYGAAEKATFCYQIWFLDNSTLSNEHALMLIEMDTDLAIAKQNLDLAKTSVCTFCVIWESFSMIL